MFKVIHEEQDANKVIIQSIPKKKGQVIEKFPRSSKYRGVSKNGTKWQVIYSYLIF